MYRGRLLVLSLVGVLLQLGHLDHPSTSTTTASVAMTMTHLILSRKVISEINTLSVLDFGCVIFLKFFLPPFIIIVFISAFKPET